LLATLPIQPILKLHHPFAGNDDVGVVDAIDFQAEARVGPSQDVGAGIDRNHIFAVDSEVFFGIEL